ncbi:hypothetical protein PVAP13_1KG409000 [Panicum virgatum]|uniref:Uncharacterized protein n=1 Tax=Panicum virgatum TaxID=38727 RepID=A0A8T0XPX8_PANVG|nr:hypothetical protein PVAP13_1KG409000 [Panicum virgatum]
MRRDPSPAMLLLLLLMGIELATFTCSGRSGLKSDVAAAAREHGGAALRAARAPPRTAPGVGGGRDVGAWAPWAVQGESKRLVPQGPNPLHN